MKHPRTLLIWMVPVLPAKPNRGGKADLLSLWRGRLKVPDSKVRAAAVLRAGEDAGGGLVCRLRLPQQVLQRSVPRLCAA